MRGVPGAIVAGMLLFLVVSAPPVESFEIGVSVQLDNFAFEPTRTETQTDFAGSFLWGLSVSTKREVLENIVLEAGFSVESYVGNMLYALLHYTEGVLDIGVGPFFGFFNTVSTPFQSGISTRVNITVPGIISFSVYGDNTIGGTLVQAGDYMQERNEISLGSFIGKTALALAVLSKRFTTRNAEGTDVTDSLVEYALRSEFSQMEYFYLRIALGYREFSKIFAGSSTTVKHTLGSVLLGVTLETQLTDYLVFFGEFESTPYIFGLEYLTGYSQLVPFGYFFHIDFGINLDVDRLLNP